jgi:hypothetical protein
LESAEAILSKIDEQENINSQYEVQSTSFEGFVLDTGSLNRKIERLKALGQKETTEGAKMTEYYEMDDVGGHVLADGVVLDGEGGEPPGRMTRSCGPVLEHPRVLKRALEYKKYTYK